MALARWPNEGFVEIERLIEPGEKGVKPSVFEYRSDRHARWLDAEDPWLFGYFRWLWADSTIKIGSIDTKSKTITTAEAYDSHDGPMKTQPAGIIYYAFNLLEEIDTPGEWYLNRDSGVLYFWPPSDPNEAVIEIGMLSEPMVTATDVRHLRIEGLEYDLSRSNGLVINNSEDLIIAGCTVKRFPGNGITIEGGKRCGILGCHIHTLGRRGTEVFGGHRTTLEAGEHFVENCRIHDFGRIDRTYTPAVHLEGVGNRVAHNLMYNAPRSVMRIEGNDHLIEFNETHNAVQESDDQGAMDLYYNPSYRGVVFRYNVFYDNGKTGSEPQVWGQAAIRLDDAICGVVIYGNIFIRISNRNFGAIQINSGRDNTFDNNIFADCTHGISGGWIPENTVWRLIREGNPRPDVYINDLYLSRYPAMAQMMEPPGINNIWRNVFYRCGDMHSGSADLFDKLANGVFDDDPGFGNAEHDDFSIRHDAMLFDIVGFRPIPTEEIGLYEDAWGVALASVSGTMESRSRISPANRP